MYSQKTNVDKTCCLLSCLPCGNHVMYIDKQTNKHNFKCPSANQLETVPTPLVAQQVHALQNSPPGGHASMVSILIQTDEDFPDMNKLMEEKKDLEKRLQDVSSLWMKFVFIKHVVISDSCFFS